MSPGLTLRPSLSGALQLVVPETVQGVAGVDAPAFVERTEPYSWFQSDTAVSPGLTLRPSLSAETRRTRGRPVEVSPGLTLRPSLSASR